MDLIDKFIDNLISTDSAKTCDDSLKENASFAAKAGLEVRVTRVYDGVGLSGKRQCQWCLERCGTNMTLQEAYEKGAFQRHEGCGCIIEYTSAKGERTVQTAKYSGWNFANELEKRKTIGLDEGFFADELMSRIKTFIGVDAVDLYNTAKNGGLYKETLDLADSLTKPQLEKAIRSHIQRAEEHEWKIRNPEKYAEQYKTGDDRVRKGILRDWESHRKKNARLAALEIQLWEDKFK